MPTALDLTDKDIADFRRAARRREQQARRALAQREKRAWAVARQAADMLREQFAIEKLVVFGSLVHLDCFTSWSDVDLAVWGLSPLETFRAIGVAMDLASDIEINLVDVGTCSPSLLAAIERDGVEL
jgi:predicted nucleotidyltransferase